MAAEDDNKDPRPASEAKQPYTKPEVIDYGNVSELTRGGGTKGGDAHPPGRLA